MVPHLYSKVDLSARQTDQFLQNLCSEYTLGINNCRHVDPGVLVEGTMQVRLVDVLKKIIE